MNILEEIISRGNPQRAIISQRFFKTGIGEYGEGDIFLGLSVPETRKLVKQYAPYCTLDEVNELLQNQYHEVRLAGALILVYFAQKKVYPITEIASCYLQNAGFSIPEKKKVFRGQTVGARGIQKRGGNQPTASFCPLNSFGIFSEKSTKGSKYHGINNWDLVDVSSEHIIGPYIEQCLTHKERVVFINNCIASSDIWVNRIIILASFYQIKQGNEKLTIYIAEKMLHHHHDLIHKALGWMLREVGKRCSLDILRAFLDTYAHQMPRTMLRYAIEKMDKKEQQHYLNIR